MEEGGEVMETHLKEYREKSGLSQDELAEISGVSRDVILGFESGIINVTTTNTMKKLADALNVKVTAIFFD